jgi:hypothetical protein
MFSVGRESFIVGIRKRLSIILCTTMMFSLLLGTIAPALAKSSREAVIDSVVGEVNVTKAGGSKSYRAFAGMTLNQGDHIETGVGSKVVLRIVDHDDEITIDQKTSIYISELSENAKGKKSKVKMWAGSLWGKVKTLAGSDDQFEVETPTAVMGVRGTNLLVGVDPETGESTFYIASGIGEVSKTSEGEQASTTILIPNEKVSVDKNTPADKLEDYKIIADPGQLITKTSSAIIEAIISSKAAIDQENDEYIAKLQETQNQTGESNQENIDRINANLINLVGNIVKNAISQNKVEEVKIIPFIEVVNLQLERKLHLDTVKDQQLSEQEKAKQAQVKLLEEERKKKQEEEKRKQEELKKQNKELQKKLKEQLEKQQAEKKKAEEEAKKKAAEEYAKKLADEAAKLAFEAKLKAIADEKAKQDAARALAAAIEAAEAAAEAERLRLKALADAIANQPRPAKLITEVVQGTASQPALLNVYLQDFLTSANMGVYAVQLHFTYNGFIELVDTTPDSLGSAAIFNSDFVYYFNDVDYSSEGSESNHTELIFVVTKYAGSDINVDGRKLLVSIPLNSYGSGGQIKPIKAIVVDRTGNKHTFEFDDQALDIVQNAGG